MSNNKPQTTDAATTDSKKESPNHQVMVTIYRPDGSIMAQFPRRMFGNNADHAMLGATEETEQFDNKVTDYDAVAGRVTLDAQDGYKITLSFDKKRRTQDVKDPKAALLAKLNRK